MRPMRQAVSSGAVNCFVDLFAFGEMKVVRSQSAQIGIARGDALKQIGGQDCAFSADGDESITLTSVQDETPGQAFGRYT